MSDSVADPQAAGDHRARVERITRLTTLDTQGAPPAVVLAHVTLLLGAVWGDDPHRIGRWLTTPLSDLDGDSPSKVIALGEGGAVVTLLVSTLAGSPGG